MGVDLLRDGLLRVDVREEAVVVATNVTEAAPAASCHVCATRPGVQECVSCKRPVCTQDLWVMYGLCRACLTEEELKKSREPKARARPELGIKWVED